MRIGWALLAPLAACHGGASTPDTTVDSDSSQVTVSITDDQGSPSHSLSVYFQNADGSLALETTTDASGRAAGPIDAGGFVSVLRPGSPGQNLAGEIITILDVAPGDALKIGPTLPTASSVQVIIPADPTALNYRITSSCGTFQTIGLTTPQTTGNLPPKTIGLTGCGPTADILVVTGDSTGFSHWLAAPAADVASGSVTLTGAYQNLAPRSLRFDNTPAGQQVVTFSLGGVFTSTSSGAITGGTVMQSVDEPVLAGAIATVDTRFSDAVDSQQIIEWGPDADYTLDYTALGFPRFASPATFDVAARTIAWTEGPGALAADVTMAFLFCTRATTSTTWTWEIASARGSTPSLVVPAVAARTSFPLNIEPGDTVQIDRLYRVVVPGGYPAVRTELFHGPDSGVFVPGLLVRGGSGRIVSDVITTM